MVTCYPRDYHTNYSMPTWLRTTLDITIQITVCRCRYFIPPPGITMKITICYTAGTRKATLNITYTFVRDRYAIIKYKIIQISTLLGPLRF